MTTHNSPEEIRRDIERTRAELSDNVNALGDGANPANVARRQVDKVKDGAASLKHRVFGDPHDPWDDGAVGDVQTRAAGAVEAEFLKIGGAQAQAILDQMKVDLAAAAEAVPAN